jgi:hypothetical protein
LHGNAGGPQEVAPVTESIGAEPEIGLVDKPRAFETVAGAFLGEFICCKPPKFIINLDKLTAVRVRS